MQKALESLQMLKAGNARFVAAVRNRAPISVQAETSAMSNEQMPFAIILSCADSRVPVETVFNQGFGSLFVLRVAGNIVAPTQLASMEFAVDRFSTPLIIVLGHSNCGAVAATINLLENPDIQAPENMRPILEPMRSAIEPLMSTELSRDSTALMAKAVRANVQQATIQLRAAPGLLKNRIHSKDLLVVGAEYSLETGVVDFFDGAAGA